MEGELVLRPAAIQDADHLFQWRNDPTTRGASHEKGELELEVHYAWLQRVLIDPSCILMIAEVSERAIGTVRAEREPDGWKLSWTISPVERGRGYGKSMVEQFVKQLRGSLWAEVRVGNEASIRIAEGVGMRLASESGRVRCYVLENS